MEDLVNRRMFLARAGVLGLTVGAPAGLFAAPAQAGTTGDAIDQLVRWLTPALDALSRETFDALTVFCVPGDDLMSRRQGRWHSQPGGLATGTGSYLMDTFNRYLSIPDVLWIPVVLEGSKRLGPVPLPLPLSLRLRGLGEAQQLDRALKLVIENDAGIPAPVIVTLLLNITATIHVPLILLRPSPYTSPFARLTYREKGNVFRDMESPSPKLLTALRPILDANLDKELPPLMNFLTNALLAFPSGGLYSEQQTYDEQARRVTRRPLGWNQSKYLPGMSAPPDGHPELLGYYQDRTEVTA